jgi:predicted AAA+ superfamily ATPase
MIERVQCGNIKKLLMRFPAVALLGARQTGKTTVAMQIASSRKEQALYLDLEKDSHLQRLHYDAEAYLTLNRDKLIIIDEVQRKPELFALLRALIDEKRKPGRFLLLGSSSPHLVKGVSESLAGRIAYTEIGGISIDEALKSKIIYETLWLKGGFPSPLLVQGENLDDEWYRYFVQSYINRDLGTMFGVNLSEKTVENFWKMLAGNNGALFNKEIYARSLGVTAPTVGRYLQYMEGAFLVNELQPWATNTGKRLVKMPKIYIRDSGILHALNRIRTLDDLFGSIHAGASWEGFVIEQLRLVKGNCDLYFYRTHTGAEADIVLVKGNQPIACIEIKISTSPKVSRGFYEVINDLKTTQNFVIMPAGDAYPIKENVYCYSITEFIQKIMPSLTA